MRKNFIFLAVLITGSFLLLSCHHMKRLSFSKEGPKVSKRGIASANFTPSLPAFVFRHIPAGSFLMGSPANERGRQDDEAQKPVEISKSFVMMTKEVTQEQWYEVMGENPSHFKREGDCENWDGVRGMCPQHPVEQVSWDMVQEYIKRLNRMSGLSGCHGGPQDRRGCYRLPTEAEWEWAVRAETQTAYFFGDDPRLLRHYAWYREEDGSRLRVGGPNPLGAHEIVKGERAGRTHKVGTKRPNRWGLYDVSGNVWEWVQDAYRDTLPGGRDPLVTTGSNRVLRGGGWYHYAKDLRSADRDGYHPGHGNDGIGFRLVRTL